MTTPPDRRTLMVLGAGRGQVGLLRAAREAGHRTVVVTLPGEGLPGVPLADEVEHANLLDVEAVADVARRVRPDGIATSCMDTAVPALAEACAATGLPGLSPAAAMFCADKASMKAALETAGVPSPRHVEVRSADDLEAALERLRLPVMVKATDLQGSLGVIRADSAEEARTAYHHALGASRRDVLVVEEFVDGVEFGAQALVTRGEVRFVLLHDDQVATAAGSTIPVGHSVPFSGDPDRAEAAVRIVHDAIAALGLDDCAVNVDLIADDRGVYVIELTGRAGANGLPELTSCHLEQDYFGVLVSVALGDQVQVEGTPVAAAVRMLHQDAVTGRLDRISFDEALAEQVELTLFVQPGDEVRRFRSSNDCLGQAHTSGPDVARCLGVLDELEASMEVHVVEERS